MTHATRDQFAFFGRRDRNGVAVLLVLAVIAIALALTFALSQSTSTMVSITSREGHGLEARSAVLASVGPTLSSLGTNANWMPSSSPMLGTLASGESYQVDLQISAEGGGRIIDAAAQVYDLNTAGTTSSQYGQTNGNSLHLGRADTPPIADQHLQIKLAKQTRSNLPTAAIMTFASRTSTTYGPPVYIAFGNTVRGNVRSRGPIQFQTGFVLEGTSYLMGNVSRTGTGTGGYYTYRTSSGATYAAELLADHGKTNSSGQLTLKNVALGPSKANPMGVFYHQGGEVVLEDNVIINGTLAVNSDLTINGTGIQLIALQPAVASNGNANDADSLAASNSEKTSTLTAIVSPAVETVAEALPDVLESDTSVKATFPVAVVDGFVTINESADAVRISGTIVARRMFRRLKGTTASLKCKHDHTLSLDSITDPFASSDGPAVYIRGSILATRVSLEHRAERPFALVYEPSVTNVADAPGFFTWRVSEWAESN